MELKELLKILNYYIGMGDQGAFAKDLFRNVYDPPEGMKKKDNPVEKLSETTFSGYFSTHSISKLAFQISPHLSKEKLIKYLSDNLTEDNLEWLVDDLEENGLVYDFPVTSDNIIEIISEELISIIRSEAKEYDRNKRKPRTSRDACLNIDDIYLYNESDGTCPLCYKKIRIPGSSIKGASSCRIVQLYTTRLADECGLFDSVEIPDDLNGDENKIVLCEKCANKYEKAPTIHTYQILKEIKKNCVMSRSLNSLSLDEEIMEVVEALYSVDGDDEKIKELALTYEPVEVDKKITDNYILKREIRSKVIDFFNYVDIKLSELDENVMRSDEIASDIHRAYKRLKENNFEKNEIVNKLSEWILEKTKLNHKNAKYKSAAEIIVAYYIQSCQVFEDETSK